MKSLTMMLLGMLLTSVAYAQTENKYCFDLDSKAASEPQSVCIFLKEKYAEITASKIILEKIDLLLVDTKPVDLGNGKIWTTIEISGLTATYAIKATWHSIMPMGLSWVKNLKTGQTFYKREYRGPRPRPHTQCNGTGPCL